MTEAPHPYPLCWPDTLPRKTGHREAGSFKTALPGAMKNVQDSLRRFGALSNKPVSSVVISSNVTLGVNNPADPGVAVWFVWEGNQVCIPVDRYSTVAANVQAIHHVLEARCTELRHGTLSLVRATMKGFIALPAPESWRSILGFEPGATPDQEGIEIAYRMAAKKAGPNSPRLYDINRARDQALKEIAE